VYFKGGICSKSCFLTPQFYFHISSKVSNKNTDSTRLAKHIHEALLEMKTLFEDDAPAA